MSHMTLDDRVTIQEGLDSQQSCNTIAKKIGKNRSTVTREIEKHRVCKGRINEGSKAPCVHAKTCTIMGLCKDIRCFNRCSQCVNCLSLCEKYEPAECKRLARSPHVCNGCNNNTVCKYERYYYYASYAHNDYQDTLISTREGINQDPESLSRLDALVSPLIQKGQPLAHIFATHGDEIKTRLFYCNPQCSWQKGALEKNHEFIRYVLPKGTSFDHLSQDDITLLMNHINSVARDKFHKQTPYALSTILIDNKLHEVMKLVEIKPDDVFLKPSLLKKHK